MASNSRVAQWEQLYDSLVELLARWGRNQDGNGPDDYLIIDDDWGGWNQKIEFVNSDLPIGDISKSVQELLAAKFKRWSVIFVFSDGTDREGLRLYADRVVRQSDDPEAD